MVVSEHYIEAIAEKLALNIDDVRTMNLYKEGAYQFLSYLQFQPAEPVPSQVRRRRTTSPSSTGTSRVSLRTAARKATTTGVKST